MGRDRFQGTSLHDFTIPQKIFFQATQTQERNSQGKQISQSKVKPFSKKNLHQFCAIKSINFSFKLLHTTCPMQHSIGFYLLCIHYKKVIVNKVSLFPKIKFKVSLYSWYYREIERERKRERPFIHSVENQEESTQQPLNYNVFFMSRTKFGFLRCFKESRKLFFFFMAVMFQVTIESQHITIKKFSSIFDSYFHRKLTCNCPIPHIYPFSLVKMVA